jgi:hypothetical protein
MQEEHKILRETVVTNHTASESVLIGFLNVAASDYRIGPLHISLYASILKLWIEQGCKNPFSIFSHQLMPICKIQGHSTYHCKLKDLHERGYIVYRPSFNHFEGSQILLKRTA